jgi:hypothetical protein
MDNIEFKIYINNSEEKKVDAPLSTKFLEVDHNNQVNNNYQQ